MAIFPELGFTFRDIKHVCICLLYETLKAQISAILLRRLPRRRRSKDDKSQRDCKPKLGENDHRSPSNRAQGHAYRQTLVGSLLQPRDHRDTRKKRYFKIVPICLNLSINPTKRSSIYGNHGNQASSARSSGQVC